MSIITNGFLSAIVNGIAIHSSCPCHSGNYTNKTSRNIKYLVIHYTGNAKDTALSNCKYFQTKNRSASAHFFCDDSYIYQSVKLKDTAWHCGCTVGYKTACRNSNSIGIEMCTSGNYTVSEQTQINAAYLCAYLCRLIGISSEEVDTYILRHYDVVKTNKYCPAPFVKDSSQWIQFKTWIKNILNTGNHNNSLKEIPSASAYTKIEFIKDIQAAIGVSADGIVGNKTLSALPTVSRYKNKKHPVVKPLQKYLNSLGYPCGTVDGIAGEKFENAAKAWAKENNCIADGEFTKGGNSWKRILDIL